MASVARIQKRLQAAATRRVRGLVEVARKTRRGDLSAMAATKAAVVVVVPPSLMPGQRGQPSAPKPVAVAILDPVTQTAPTPAAPEPAQPVPAPTQRMVKPAFLPNGPIRRPWLKVAVVLDDFSALAYNYEFEALAVTPQDWRDVMDSEKPDLLLCESAWQGNSGAWNYHFVGTSAPRPALVEMLEYCRAHGIPSVIWNKEDPPHFEDFIDTVALFDYVLTTDSTMLPLYHQRLGHDRVGVLPFAAQPRIHHPLRVDEDHARPVAFAGMYFAEKYPERQAQTDLLLGAALPLGLEIFSRALGGADKYQFPERFAGRIVGSLPYPQMLTANKQYKVFLNVNSVVNSPSMCARRIFELSACNTAVVSGETTAVPRFFPDGEIPVVETQADAEHTLRTLVMDDDLRERMVHSAKREVFARHTYSHRVATILEMIGLEDRLVSRAWTVALDPREGSQAEVEQLLSDLEAQVRAPDLVLWCGAEDDVPTLGSLSVKAVGSDLAAILREGGEGWLAVMRAGSRYGANYLLDGEHATLWAPTPAIGRLGRYVFDDQLGALVLLSPDAVHRRVASISADTAMVDLALTRFRIVENAAGRGLDDLVPMLAQDGVTFTSLDRFNFVERAPRADSSGRFVMSGERPLAHGASTVWGPAESVFV